MLNPLMPKQINVWLYVKFTLVKTENTVITLKFKSKSVALVLHGTPPTYPTKIMHWFKKTKKDPINVLKGHFSRYVHGYTTDLETVGSRQPPLGLHIGNLAPQLTQAASP